ncbi:alpha/beta hydrolase [Actinokineospora enzanensis]|uniref:alpha/beta hydrolase n=1 Tax=Actinokineospora enzanensis TaxID=155975 RepID=UPI0003A368A5|nr:alpha/beta hydrolase [Actinokineospora enzanensis]
MVSAVIGRNIRRWSAARSRVGPGGQRDGHGGGIQDGHEESDTSDENGQPGRRRATGEPVGPIVTRFNGHLAERAVPEWRSASDALQALPEIGPDAPVGYLGLSMGTAIGVPLAAADSRIKAAIFGTFWHGSLADTARRVTIPVEFLVQWDDEHVPRDSAIALFDAFGSAKKTLHANVGRHLDVPGFELDSAIRFLARHLV